MISIVSVRGRARGNGAEFLVACDLRFASKEKAILGQMEVGVGAIPDSELDEFVDAFANRISIFDKEIIAETKSLINQRSGGIAHEDIAASMSAFFKS